MVMSGLIGVSVLSALRPMHADALRPLISVSLVALMVITLVEMRKHERSLCEWCASAMPLNPAQAAETYRSRLAFVHLIADKRRGRVYLGAVITASLLPFIAPSAVRPPVLVLSLAAAASVVYLVLSQVTHRRLQPWCPQCGDSGGEDVDTPTPMPIDSLSG